MRNAFFTFPNQANTGESFSDKESRFGDLTTRLRRTLGKAFGGFTATTAEGFWIDAETGNEYPESVTVYKIAADWTPELESNLRAIAARFAALGEQVCVMVELQNGGVEFINPDSDLVAALTSARDLLAA